MNFVCSLGQSCAAATIIQRNNLKKMSFPFDWIFINHTNVIDCLDTRFSVFLDKKYYKLTPNNKCEHLYYQHSYGPMFNHVNPIDDNVYFYYSRCVDRFDRLMKSSHSKLFIMTFLNNSSYPEIKHDLVDFNNKLKNFTNNYKLLCIVHISNKEKTYHNFDHLDNIDFLELHTRSCSNGVSFEEIEDNNYIDKIIKETYNFSLQDSI